MTTSPVSSSNSVLLVEGPDDKHISLHIQSRDNSIPSFQPIDKTGIPNLLTDIPVEINVPGRRAVGIIVDADTHVRNRWQQVASRIQQAGISVPSHPNPKGTIVLGRPDGASRKPRIGIWLMPNNRFRGEIENFIQTMIPTSDPVWPLSDAYVDGIPKRDRKFRRRKTTRAKVHAWLATREEPRHMGVAIRAGDLDINGPLCTRFREWLRRLFN